MAKEHYETPVLFCATIEPQIEFLDAPRIAEESMTTGLMLWQHRSGTVGTLEKLRFFGEGQWVAPTDAVSVRADESDIVVNEAGLLSDDLHVFSGGRLDGLDDVARQLGLDARTSRSHVLSCGYRIYGEALFERLRGPFWIIVWDGRSQLAKCARDHLGVSPMYYCETGDLTAIATSVAPLLSLPAVSKAVRIDSVVSFLSSCWEDVGSFFEGIEIVQPGAFLTMSSAGATQSRFWAPKSSRKPAVYVSIEEYQNGYRERLSRAVERSSRGLANVAISLSGGIDSSSIMALASEAFKDGSATARPVSYTNVFPRKRFLDERRYAASVTALHGSEHKYVETDEIVRMALPISKYVDTPWRIIFENMHRLSYHEMKSDGIRAALNGTGADDMWIGSELAPHDAIAAWHPLAFYLCLKNHRRKREVLARGATSLLRKGLPAAARAGILSGFVRPGEFLVSGLTEEIVNSYGIEERRRAANMGPAFETEGTWAFWEAYLQAITKSASLFVLPSMRAIAAEFSIDLRFPFHDVDLVEYAITIPPHVFYDPSRSKAFAVDALSGSLPQTVARRKINTSLNPIAAEIILGLGSDVEPVFRDSWLEATGLVVRGALLKEYRNYIGSAGVSSSWVGIWIAYCVEKWVRGIEGL